MAHDALVGEEAIDIHFGEGCDLIDVEPGKAGAERFPLIKNRPPTQARLKAFETQLLKEAGVIADGKTPFVIVIG